MSIGYFDSRVRMHDGSSEKALGFVYLGRVRV